MSNETCPPTSGENIFLWKTTAYANGFPWKRFPAQIAMIWKCWVSKTEWILTSPRFKEFLSNREKIVIWITSKNLCPSCQKLHGLQREINKPGPWLFRVSQKPNLITVLLYIVKGLNPGVISKVGWTQTSDKEWWRQQSHCWAPFTDETSNWLGLCSATCITYSTDCYQRLTLESWFTNLEQTPLNRSQQLPALYRGLIDEIKQN